MLLLDKYTRPNGAGGSISYWVHNHQIEAEIASVVDMADPTYINVYVRDEDGHHRVVLNYVRGTWVATHRGYTIDQTCDGRWMVDLGNANLDSRALELAHAFCEGAQIEVDRDPETLANGQRWFIGSDLMRIAALIDGFGLRG